MLSWSAAGPISATLPEGSGRKRRRARVATRKSPMPPVWPVVTFGAKRYPALNQAPTFQESIGPQPPNRRYNSITAAIGLFGPPGMKPVGRLVTEFTAAGAAARQSGAI